MTPFSQLRILAACAIFSTVHAYTPPAGAVSAIGSYRGYSDLTTAAGAMDIDLYTKNLTTWQMPHGGFFKAYAAKYKNPWNGTDARSDQVRNNVELGTIDNNATIQEMRLLAVRYKATTNTTYKATFKASFQKALGFLVTSQQAKGSWPQMYPARGNYSDMATYNDNAMIRVMVLAKDITDGISPFDSDIATATQKTQLSTALGKAVDFALKSQIYNNNQPTVWCAQHDPSSYAPVTARAYELPSKSGSESAGVVWFLMNWPDQSAAIQKAVKGAIAWYKKNRVPDMKFSEGNFIASSGSSMWYRFYEVNSDAYFFCDRAGESSKTQDITKLSDDRRYGYQWAGDYGSKLLAVEASYLTAIASVPLSSSMQTPSSSGSSSAAMSSVSTDCGGTACTTIQQGENYCNINGLTESKNAGYLGTGYANPDNAIGASIGYTVHASTAGSFTLYIRYANGTAATRNAKIMLGSQTLVPDVPFPTTGAWTSWQVAQVNLQLPAGRDSLSIQSLTADGAPNLDWLGWNNGSLTVANCQATTAMQNRIGAIPVRLIGKIQNGNLILNQIPAGGFTVRIRSITGSLVAEIIAPSTGNISLGHLERGVFVFEIVQDQKVLSRFSIPND